MIDKWGKNSKAPRWGTARPGLIRRGWAGSGVGGHQRRRGRGGGKAPVPLFESLAVQI